MQRAIKTIMSEMAIRIFDDGKNSADASIGAYNTQNEMYVDPDTLPRNVTPRGKPGKEKNIQGRKTAYFKSYSALRSEMGRESSKINLRLTNDLQSDWSNAEVSKGDNTIAKSPSPIKVTNLEYKINLKRDENILKRRGLEDRFGAIFAMTSNEKKRYFEILDKEIRSNA